MTREELTNYLRVQSLYLDEQGDIEARDMARGIADYIDRLARTVAKLEAEIKELKAPTVKQEDLDAITERGELMRKAIGEML